MDCFAIDDDIAMSQVYNTAHSGDNDADDLLLTQMCAELESQDDDTALVVAHVEEMRESESHLGITHDRC